ncbi:MAG: sulfurtransferase TusA family protein [Deltaproteobacteria bacterium]|nr:sulfurtransferase TusA family protein [Deltaproteobacteria bacterium]
MAATVDARGLSCPQPVLLTLDAMKTSEEHEIIVLVDTETSKENVLRAASSHGWSEKEVIAESDGFRITIMKPDRKK